MPDPCTVFELRQYTLHPGRRDELIDLFERHLVEPQEDVGMHVVGQFRHLERPDRFVWLRGFRDMPARGHGLTRFYLQSDAWATHRAAANATMIDSDDVLLLRPVPGFEPLCAHVGPRAAVGAEPHGRAGAYAVTVHHLAGPTDAVSRAWLAERRAVLESAGARLTGVLASEHAANNFPRLPVRQNVDVLVTVARYDSVEAAARDAPGGPAPFETTAPAERLVLAPTARSALR